MAQVKSTLVGFLWIVFLFFVNARIAAADAYGLDASARSYNTGATVQSAIGTIINAILSVVGALFFGLIVYGGVLWMISRDEEKKKNKATELITNSVMGLVIVLGAYVLVKFITTSLAQGVLK